MSHLPRRYHPRSLGPIPKILPLVFIVTQTFTGCAGEQGTDNAPAAPSENEVPTANISSPSSGGTYVEGEQISFEGSASDPEDGALTGSSLSWASNEDGNLGTGEVLTVNSLSVTTHAIVLTATDSEGATDKDSVEVTVETNQAPSATIDIPSQDTTVQEGDTVKFRGSATDPNEATLADSALQWESNLSGNLGEGRTVSTVLASDTTHTVTLTVTDPQGETDSDQLSVTVDALTDWAQVNAGGAFSCGLDQDGTAYCWGNGNTGVLGTGTTTEGSTEPVQVATDSAYTNLSSSGGHNCGITSSGVVYCWGGKSDGELGDGTTTNRNEPVPVTGNITFEQINGGQNHTCGLTGAGSVYCWGSNLDGQVGDGTETDRVEPVEVSDNLTFSHVSAGPENTCGLTEDGVAYCWGANNEGQVGDGTTTQRHSPTQVAGGILYTDITVGANHACGIGKDGTTYCWGDNDEGELGDGTGGTSEAHSTEPVAVVTDQTFETIDAGRHHTCGVNSDDQLYCWGSNEFDALGDGSYEDYRLEPVPVAIDRPFAQVSGGDGHTCGATLAGSAYCWGSNSEGELGNGSITTSEREPVKVVEPKQ